MTFEIALVLIILGFAILLFVTEWVRMDLVGLLVMSSLALTGLVTPAEALSGFSNPAVITVWAVLILSGALGRTGVASVLGRFVIRLAGESETRLLVIIMLTTGILSGFMNSIGVVSLFLPVVVDISRRTNQPPSKLLMPLSFACLMGNMITLISTPSNLLISEALHEAGLQAFTMFDYTPVGISVLLTGTLFMVLIGRRLLPSRDISREISTSRETDVTAVYDLQERMVFLRLPENTNLAGKTLEESRLGSALELNVVTVVRNGKTLLAPEPEFTLQPGDRLLVEGRLDRLIEIHESNHLQIDQNQLPIEKLVSAEIDLVEVSISPGSALVGHTLRQVAFRHVYHVIVVAIRRGKQVVRTNLEKISLQSGDVLLVQGKRSHLETLDDEPELTVSPPEDLSIYELEDRLLIARVPEGSALDGLSLVSSRLGDAFGLSVLGIVRKDVTELMPDPQEILHSGDTLLIKGKPKELRLIEGLQDLVIESQKQPDLRELETEETGLVEAVLSPHSTLAGRAIREVNFRAKYGLTILAIWREGRAYRSHLREMKLRFGDALLLFGSRERLRMLGSEPNFLVLSEEALPPPKLQKASLAGSIMLLVLLSVILGWVPIAIAAVVGASLMILCGCLTMEEAYRQIEWQAVFLIAGMLPLGNAMAQTGAASFLGDAVISLIGGYGPLAVMAGLFLVAALGSQVMPNPAVAVLLAPIALNTASRMGISPYTLMMTVAVSSSAAFLSPVGHADNMLVMGPGGYKFSDYVKVGLPLTLIVLITVLLVMPLFWPF